LLSLNCQTPVENLFLILKATHYWQTQYLLRFWIAGESPEFKYAKIATSGKHKAEIGIFYYFIAERSKRRRSPVETIFGMAGNSAGR